MTRSDPQEPARTILKQEPDTLVERLGSGADAVVRKVYSNRGIRLLQSFWRRARAAREQRVLSPLAEIGLRKDAIRRLSRIAGLETADLPSSPCLASRFPAGVEVTEEALARVEAAENALRAMGFRELRVRHHGDVARIELPGADVPRLLDPALRTAISTKLRALGYRFVSLDLEDFRSGRGSTPGG